MKNFNTLSFGKYKVGVLYVFAAVVAIIFAQAFFSMYYTQAESELIAIDQTPRTGSISGCKYLDASDDGELDTSNPLSGWEFRLYQFPNAPWKIFPEDQPMATYETEKDGCFTFDGLAPGIYQVYEKVKPGWVQTHPPKTTDHGLTPNPQEGGNVLPLSLLPTVVTATTTEDSPDRNWINTKLFQNSTMFAILGNSWNCLFSNNCNTAQREELTNIRYYTVHLGTNSDGAVDEEKGFVMDVTGADFGNYGGKGTITGKKFYDEDKDGKQDENEPGIPGWEIALYDYATAPWIDTVASSTPIQIAITDSNGDYKFENIPSGLYQVFEVEQDGWKQTFPKPHATYLPTTLTPTEKVDVLLLNDISAQKMLGCAGSIVPCSDELHKKLLAYRYYGILLKPDATVSGVNFGNYQKLGAIHGNKFEDVDGDGVWDDGEEGLPGWEMSLYQMPNAPWMDAPDNTPLATKVTDANGKYSFDDLLPGIYQVYETKQEDWTQYAPVGTQPSVLATTTVLGANLVKTKLTENPTSQKLLGCIASTTPCSDELQDLLTNMRYFSILVGPGDIVENADFGNQHKPIVIDDEEITTTDVEEGDSLTATWHTNIFSTSRVIYGTVSITDISSESAPNYGYQFSTPTTDISPKVQDHSVTITGLTPGTTYYWRAISSASPEVVGGENVVTTPAVEVNQNNSNTAAASNNSGGGSGGGGGSGIVGSYGTANNSGTTNTTSSQNTPPASSVVQPISNSNLPVENTSSPSISGKRLAQAEVRETNTVSVLAQEEDTSAVNNLASAEPVDTGSVIPSLTENDSSSNQLAALSGLNLPGYSLWIIAALVALGLIGVLRLATRNGKV